MEEKTKDPFTEKLDRLVSCGMQKTQQFCSMWNENLRYFFSDQLHGKPQRKNWEWVILNYIWPSAMQEIAKLTKNNPKIVVQPWESSDTQKAEAWESNLNWHWKQGINNHGMRLEQIRSILDKKIYGYSVSKIYWEEKCYWDEAAQQWMGDVKHKLWHPTFFWADSDENVDDGNCGTERFATLEWAINRWPKFKKKLEDESKTWNEMKSEFASFEGGLGTILNGQKSTQDDEGTGGSDNFTTTIKPNRLVEIITGYDPIKHSPEESDQRFVKIQEIYLKDYSETTVKETQPVNSEELKAQGTIYEADGIFYDTNTNEQFGPEQWPEQTIREYTRPKFPNGRYIIRVGSVILNPKEEDQVYPYSRWPFVVTPHYLLPHMWQGVDGVQLYKTTQDMLNVTVSHLYNNLKQFGDPKVAVETGAIETPPGRKSGHYRIGAGAGSIIRLVKGALSRKAFQILDPPQPPAIAGQLYQLFAQEYKNIQGLQSIAMGEKTPGKMSATESVHLATSSVDRIALQAVFEDYWVVECSKLIAELCQKHYDIGRWVRIVGETGIAGVQQITSDLKNVRFDISIIPGTTLPFDEEKRAAKYLQAYQLLSDPMPNPMLPEVLRVLEIYNWQKILAQHQGWQKFAQFMQLIESVKSGQTQPQQAMAMLGQEIMAVAQQAMMTGGEQTRNQPNS
jgi:hypothetical protein